MLAHLRWRQCIPRVRSAPPTSARSLFRLAAGGSADGNGCASVPRCRAARHRWSGGEASGPVWSRAPRAGQRAGCRQGRGHQTGGRAGRPGLLAPLPPEHPRHRGRGQDLTPPLRCFCAGGKAPTSGRSAPPPPHLRKRVGQACQGAGWCARRERQEGSNGPLPQPLASGGVWRPAAESLTPSPKPMRPLPPCAVCAGTRVHWGPAGGRVL